MHKEDRVYFAIVGLIIGLLVAGIVVVIVMAVKDSQKKDECRASGGYVEEYDCHTSTICTTVNNITTCTPSKSCKWRCIGPERSDK